MPTTDERCSELREVVERAVLGQVPDGWDDETDAPTWRDGTKWERLVAATDAVDELHHMVHMLAVSGRATERVMAAHGCGVSSASMLAEYMAAVDEEERAWPDTYVNGCELEELGGGDE